MKKLLLSIGFLFAFCFLGFGQVDTVAVIKQIDSLVQISRGKLGTRDFSKAMEINRSAEELVLAKLGSGAAAYGSVCANYARILHMEGKYPEAEKWYLAAISNREKALGVDHPVYAKILFSLGVLNRDLGKYEVADSIFQKSSIILEKALGKDHTDYALCLHNRGVLNMEMGIYEKSELLCLQALEIRKKNLGKKHPVYATSLDNLANLYRYMGNYEKAETLFLEAIAIQAEVLGKENPDYAQSINGIAILYWDLGNFVKAESYYLEAKAIRERTLGKETRDYASSLNNLALLYWDQGDYKKAEPLFLESSLIREKVLGKNHPVYANSLTSLAGLNSNRRNYENAERLYLEASAIQEASLGKEHPSYAVNLDGLANLYYLMGKLERAKQLYQESKVIREKVLGVKHQDFANSLKSLAIVLWANKEIILAKPLFSEAFTIEKSLLENSARYLSESEMSSFILRFSVLLNQIYSFGQIELNTASVCYDNTLFYKGLLQNTISRVNILAMADSTAMERFVTLKSYRRRLAKEYTLSINERNINLIKELEEKANTLEKELARTVAGFDQALRQVNWQEVQSALKPNEAALEFIRYTYYTPKPTDSVMYAALLLKPGMEAPAFIPLFEEKQLQTILAPLAGQGSDGLNELYAGQAGQNLFQLLWKPLESALKGSKAIYLSPAGLLHKLNLSAIPTTATSAETIGKRQEIYVVGSTRQLVLSSPASTPNSTTEAIVFGGIQYEIDTTNLAPTLMEENQTRNRGLPFSSTDSTLRGDTWRYLKYSEKEVVNVQSQLQKAGFEAKIYKGTSATEEAFKQIGKDRASPKILHLSTHGFFFPDAKNQTKALKFGSEEPVFKISDNPMIRAGLILAGGNYAWKTGKPLANREDGILTAYEISQMDLRNTDLVVLSACETGLGQIEGNEGVYGLQRAFKIAGAKHLIMSLWQIPDFHTQELMTAFYNNLLTKKMPTREALIAAQEAMRLKRYEPFYWAGFVLLE